MNAKNRRIVIWSCVGVVVLFGLVLSFKPRPLLVDLATAATGPMTLTVGDEGETRVVDVFVISSPITGRLRRIETEPGDPVIANTSIVAQIEPTEPELLDPRTEAEAKAQLSAAESAETLARSELDKAAAELRFAETELERSRNLARQGTISERDLDASERAYETARAALGSAQASMQVRRYELERAQAHLMSPSDASDLRTVCACVDVSSPIDGQVLRVLRDSEGFVNAGEPLMEIGAPDRLEVVVDLLSSDAVKVAAGDAAFIENWGGSDALEARVRRVEPFGFTKVSALGIEEQRVNVVLDILSPPEEWTRLGHGYQVDVRVVLWHEDNVLRVPMTALFRDGSDWALFVNTNGLAEKRILEVGNTTSSQAQIIAGLEDGEEFVLYPGESVEEGVRIAAR
ncbi:MAG: HlyD family efflux transporter periplasmic adaptor subunit [Woeseiaceae bacterium]|nr:HlyD family efflux transporter periplasmic adaptor subunit [Woeseiaceae bacterium]